MSWQPPPECPPRSHIESRIEEWLGSDIPKDADLRVDTSLHWTGRRWEVEVKVAFDGHQGSRRVAVDTCGEAADFIAVAVVLALDPSLAGTLPEPQQEPSLVAGPASADVSTAEATALQVAPRPGAGSTDPTPANLLLPEVPMERRRPLNPFISLGAVGSVGALPGPRLGAQLGAGLVVGNWSWALFAAFFPPVATKVPEATASIDFSLLQGRTSLAYLFGGGRLRWGPQLALNLGAIRALQLTGNPDPIRQFWVSLGLGATGTFVLGRRVRLIGNLDLDIPATQTTFGLDDGTEIYQVTVGARGELGLQFSFGKYSSEPSEG